MTDALPYTPPTPAEFRAIRYSIARRVRGEPPEVAAFIADAETQAWQEQQSPSDEPLAKAA